MIINDTTQTRNQKLSLIPYLTPSLLGNSATRMRQMRLAITWGHAKVAKEFIFSRKEYKFSVS